MKIIVHRTLVENIDDIRPVEMFGNRYPRGVHVFYNTTQRRFLNMVRVTLDKTYLRKTPQGFQVPPAMHGYLWTNTNGPTNIEATRLNLHLKTDAGRTIRRGYKFYAHGKPLVTCDEVGNLAIPDRPVLIRPGTMGIEVFASFELLGRQLVIDWNQSDVQLDWYKIDPCVVF
jgi:hypothetical protein